MGDTGSELPTRHAHGVVHETILRALRVTTGKREGRTDSVSACGSVPQLFLGRLENTRVNCNE